MYTGASFGMQVENTYDVQSTVDPPPSENVTFGSGFCFSGFLGYSIGDYAVIDAELSFGSSDTPNNYFTPEEQYITVDSSNSSNDSSSVKTINQEYFRTILGFINAYLTLDPAGADFVPYIGAGFGATSADWNGFTAGAVAWQVVGGIDLLLIPKMAMILQLRFISIGDLDFDTEHVTAAVDANGQPLVDTNGIPIYQKTKARDTLKAIEFIRVDLGTRIAF